MKTTFFDDKVDFFWSMEEQSPFAALLDELVAWAGLRPGTRVVDLGAGPGGLLRRLPHMDTVAVDFSLPMAERAQSFGHLAVQGDAQEVPLRDASFGAVFATNLLHLVPHPEAVVAEAFRVLEPGAPFLAIVPGPAMTEESLVRWLTDRHGAQVAEMLGGWGRSADAHRRFDPKGTEAMLRAAGFRTAETRLRWDDHALLAKAVK